MTKLVKIFEKGLIPNFTKTWGNKNIFNHFNYEWLFITCFL